MMEHGHDSGTPETREVGRPGQPLSLGGSRGRVDATGRGLMLIARDSAPLRGFTLPRTPVSYRESVT